MAVNIEKMRADMRWEARKFAVSAILAAAALIGAGVAIGNLIWAHKTQPLPPAPPPIVIQIPAPK
ncbi:MAG: hypothetical protein JOY66_11105 [Acetobacteraceae bacterium]|nr:hypothetical protein [Acetobacteraceae bacterium]